MLIKRPSSTPKSPEPSARTRDWICLFSYRRVRILNEFSLNAASRYTRSQTASAIAEPRIISNDGTPNNLPATAKPTEARRQMNVSHGSLFLRVNSQAGPIRIAINAPIHFPASQYPAVKQITEIVRQITKRAFRRGIYFYSLVFPLPTRPGQDISYQWK